MATNKLILKFIVLFHLSWLLVGCSGIKEIQSEIYVTALGIDYSDNNYQLYFQAVGFNNITGSEPDIAKSPRLLLLDTDKAKPSKRLSMILKNIPLTPLLRACTSYIYFREYFGRKTGWFLDYFSRNYYLRYNTLIYAYENNIKEIMNVRGLFYKPPNLTFTYDPKEQLFLIHFSNHHRTKHHQKIL